MAGYKKSKFNFTKKVYFNWFKEFKNKNKPGSDHSIFETEQIKNFAVKKYLILFNKMKKN